MCKKQSPFQSVQRAISFLLFFVISLTTPQMIFAQESESELETELSAPESSAEIETNSLADMSQNSLSVEPIAAPTSDSHFNNYSGDGQIIVERTKDITLPYKERRNNWGLLFAINYEQFYPENYNSLILNQDFKIISGDKSIALIGAEFGLKYNFSLASISALVGYSQGQTDNTQTGLNKIIADVKKVSLNMALDGFMDEPYVVPYVQFGLHSFDWSEESTVANIIKEESFTSNWNFHYKIGLSFQLNWIEKSIDTSSQEDSLRSGLENTFIDVFYTAYAPPEQVAKVNGAEGEPDLESSEIGAGLKLEF